MRWRLALRERPEEIEVAGEGRESVWDYPRPPRVEAGRALVRVVGASGEEIARSSRSLRVLETAGPPVYYLPAEEVRGERLVATATRSLCEWKGEASYFALRAAPGEDVAWCYADPFSPYESLAGMIAFFPGRVACYLGGERVRPQPGDYYGGWVTDAIAGPFKGVPGSERW